MTSKKQIDKLKEIAKELECDESEKTFDKKLGKLVGVEKKVCPECGHVFQDNGWDGIDAHWRSKHEHIMSYGEAWPLLKW